MENSEEDITISDVFKYMVDFKKDVSTKLDEKMASLEDKIKVKVDNIENEMIKNQEQNKEMFEESNRRMRKIEEDMRNLKGPTRGMNTLQRMEMQIMEREGEEDKRERERQKMIRKKREEEIIEEEKEVERKRKNKERGERANDLQKELAEATDRQGTPPYNWELQASSWLDRQVKNVNEKIRKEDNKTRQKNRNNSGMKGMKKLRNWFGDSESEESEESEEEGENWNLIGRKDKNEKKKKKMAQKKKERRESVAKKAKNIVGIGPIKKTSIQHFQKISDNIEEAKIKALKEHLKFFLHYDEDELREIRVGATQICQKDDILYTAFENFEDIKELHSRAVACKDERVQMRNFVPPQFYKRYMFLSKRCSEVRANDRNKKTQLRFNDGDIEVLIKEKGTPEPYRTIKLEDICNLEDLPEYDHGQEWRSRKDRPIRDGNKSPNRENPPSLMGIENTHPLSRNSSIEDAPRKRQKTSEVDTKVVTEDVVDMEGTN